MRDQWRSRPKLSRRSVIMLYDVSHLMHRIHQAGSREGEVEAMCVPCCSLPPVQGRQRGDELMKRPLAVYLNAQQEAAVDQPQRRGSRCDDKNDTRASKSASDVLWMMRQHDVHAPSWLASQKFRDYVQQCSNDECEHRFPAIQMRCEESNRANVSVYLARETG